MSHSDSSILLITTDQHRFDAVGYAGHPDVRTPHVDALAAGGVRFERAYVTNPVCMPSRATLLLGQFPDAHGVRRNGIEVPDQPWGIARVLRQHGIRTGMFGKTHFCPLRRDYDLSHEFHNWRSGPDYYGFEERAITHDLKDYVSDTPTHTRTREQQRSQELIYTRDDYIDWMTRAHPDLYTLAIREGLLLDREPSAPELWTSEVPTDLHQSTWITDRTLDFMARHRNERFFAWCSYVDPHHPFNAPRAHRALYDAETLAAPVWQEGELDRRSVYHRQRHQEAWEPWRDHWREYRAQYYGMVSLIDEQVGRLMAGIHGLGLLDRVAVIFTADHGEMLGDHGLARKGLFHYEPLIRVPLVLHAPGSLACGARVPGIVQSVDIPATLLDLAGVALPWQYQGISLLPWCRGEREHPPRGYALISNGGEGPDYTPWPELRTLVTDRWKLNYYTHEQVLLLDDLLADPNELHPLSIDSQRDVVSDLMQLLVDASSEASVWRPHVGRW